MTQINLLPWREQERHVQRIIFGAILGAFVAAALFVVLLFHFYLSGVIGYRTKRTDYLQQELSQVQAELNTLEKKQQEENNLLNQLRFINDLRNRSFRVVRLLDTITNLVPSTLALTKIQLEGNNITIEGIAQSDIEITIFMKNLDKPQIFSEPVLSGITAQKIGDILQRSFQLKIKQQL